MSQCSGGSQREVGVGGQGNLMNKRKKACKRTVFNFVLQFKRTCIN